MTDTPAPDDQLLFADDAVETITAHEDGSWKLLIVDDQEDVHTVTKLVLGDFSFENKPLEFISAYTGTEALEIIREQPDIAVILLDVVMETSQAGLDVARSIRSTLGNHFVRIILRTGEPGQAPERTVVNELDINDYQQKTDLTAQKLYTVVTTAVRSYRDLLVIEEGKRGMGILAISIAHQIRNRTMAIAGFANLARQKVEDDCPTLPYLKTIVEEASRLERVVESVNRFVNVSVRNISKLPLTNAIRIAMERLERRAQQKGRKVQWETDFTETNVMAEQGLLDITLTALLDNALDFNDKDPALIKLSTSTKERDCVLEITDSGSGILPEDMPHVYDPFFSRKPDGAGMGLAIAQKIAHEHHWHLTLESTPGEGTTVRLTLPWHNGTITPENGNG